MAHNTPDTTFMSEAHRLARDLVARPWPNPPVGAVVVRDGEIIGSGVHRGPGTPHAEVVALDAAGERARGATLYVTLEPCNHAGRTPPCTQRVIESGVSRVVIGARDPNPTVAGGGLEALRAAGLEVELGVLGRGCLELILPFVTTDGFRRPYVVLKTAQSTDGCFAPADDPMGEPFILTCDESLDEVHRNRRWCDLVVAGSGTLRADRPRLDGRRADGSAWCPDEDPRPACVDTDLSAAEIWRDDPFVAFTAEGRAPRDRIAALEDRGVTVVPCAERDGRVDPVDMLRRAQELGWHVIMIEGGPTLAASFLAEGLVDRWIQFVAPKALGDGLRWPSGGAPVPAGLGDFSLARSTRSDLDALLMWDRLDFRTLRKRLTREGGMR